MSFKLVNKNGIVLEETSAPIEDWTASEMFNCLVASSVIHPNDAFEDWMYDRPRMLELLRENVNSSEGV